MPIKCAGAPQKAMYLSGDHWLRNNCLANIDIEFYNAGGALFGDPILLPAVLLQINIPCAIAPIVAMNVIADKNQRGANACCMDFKRKNTATAILGRYAKRQRVDGQTQIGGGGINARAIYKPIFAPIELGKNLHPG
ncbi:MAG: hypothetical protein JKY67_10800 [Pseudomonadales bacterium]|nr:hypothetical protein [Pseudomonadales bacterium]